MLYENNIAKNSDFVKIFDYSLQKPQAENTKASQNAPTKAKCFVGALFTCKNPSAYAAFRIFNSLSESDTELRSSEHLVIREVVSRGIAGKRKNALMDSVDDPISLREEVRFKLVSGRDPVSGADNRNGSVKVIECKRLNVASHVFENGVSFNSVGSKQDSAGLLNGLNNEVIVERNDGTCVDNFRGNIVLFLKNISRFKRFVERCADGKDGDIRTLSLDIGLAERNFVVFGRNSATGSVPARAEAIRPLAS